MKLLDKILFLQKSMNLNDREFSSRFNIKSGTFKKFKSGIKTLDKENLTLICKEFNLDLLDFLDETSTLEKEPRTGEHFCKMIPISYDKETILEDFAREDNSRYEEKD